MKALRSAIYPALVICSLLTASTHILAQTASNVGASPAATSAELQARKQELQTYATTHTGDAERGRALFGNEQRVGCSKCHAVDGSTRSVGPNLSAIGYKFDRRGLVTSVLEPSQSIAIGYATTQIVTQDGRNLSGILQRVTREWVELLDKDNKKTRLDVRDIESQKESTTSLMPEGLVNQLSPAEFTDLITYLESLRATHYANQPDAVTTSIPRAAKELQLIDFFDGAVFKQPTWFEQVPIDRLHTQDKRYVVLELGGKAFVLQKNGTLWNKTLLLDVSSTVFVGPSTGLLGMTFHPHFADNHRYFVKYQIKEGDHIQTLVEERHFPNDPSDAADTSARVLLTIDAVTQDHNGGCLQFGPDGFLYIGMGDSGPQTDPQGHGQDMTTLLGKMLRIDVDHPTSEQPYSIPADNPFRNQASARPEIWAFGFREPWRFSFDPVTGDLWVGDVGQNRFEEVNIARVGENHGWNVYEGHAEHSSDYRRDDAKYIPPVFSYARALGFSITGGYVYRGQRAPQLNGAYLCGDFESRRIWALHQKDRKLVDIVEIGRASTRIVSFGKDLDGEIYLVGFDNGIIYQMRLNDVDTTPRYVRMLAETGQQGPVLWRYTTTRPSPDWTESDFDDSAWQIGPSGFGTADTAGSVVRTDWTTGDIWIRRAITLAEKPSDDSGLGLVIHHDEDLEVYLNGVEALRRNGWTVAYTEAPLSASAARSLHTGRNVMAAHCHQTSGAQYIDAGIIEYLRPSAVSAKAEK